MLSSLSSLIPLIDVGLLAKRELSLKAIARLEIELYDSASVREKLEEDQWHKCC